MFTKMYKGFIPYVKGTKQPVMKFKDRDSCYSLKYVKYDERYDGYCGVLNDDIIMIDIDNMIESEKLLQIVDSEGIKCNVMRTTDGMHFYFRHSGEVDGNKSFNRVTAAIGLQWMDIKLGSRNTVDALKFKGVEREWIREVEEIEVLPKFLYPIPKTSIGVLGLGDGSGRNEALYTYILALQRGGIGIEDSKNILRLINKYMFSVSMSDSELEVIMRDEAFLKPNFLGTKGELLHDKFAKWLIRENHIIKIDGNIYMYDNGEYVQGIERMGRIILDIIPTLKRNQRSEITSYIYDYISENKQRASARYIAFENGVLDIEREGEVELIGHSPSLVITNKIPWKYDRGAYCKVVDDTLNRMACGDIELRLVMEEMIGYCMIRKNKLGKFFILTGEGGGGKSTFLDMLSNMLGEKNVSSVSLQDLGEKFEKVALVGKLANIGDDISDVNIEDDSNLKKLITGESMQFQYKGRDAFSFKNYGKLLFASNSLPKFKDISEGLMRRIVIVPFNAKFVSSGSVGSVGYDPYIGEKLISREGAEYMIRIGIEGLLRVLGGKGFSGCEAVEKEKAEYGAYNNSVVGYIEDGGKFENENVGESYKWYCAWCAENGIRHLSKNKVSRELKNKYGISSKKIRIGEKTLLLYGKSV